ncbi:MAG TPA: hypothetical protein VMT00_09175 [Thermoanaerobaculia bacterium]|nr:hypothetical protein [Thermoanaerobaculia bacterium]
MKKQIPVYLAALLLLAIGACIPHAPTVPPPPPPPATTDCVPQEPDRSRRTPRSLNIHVTPDTSAPGGYTVKTTPPTDRVSMSYGDWARWNVIAPTGNVTDVKIIFQGTPPATYVSCSQNATSRVWTCESMTFCSSSPPETVKYDVTVTIDGYAILEDPFMIIDP